MKQDRDRSSQIEDSRIALRSIRATAFMAETPVGDGMMKLDDFKPTTVYTIYIAATPEQVWQALTAAEFSRGYFFGNAVEVEQRVGGGFIVRSPDGARHISGEVFECEPPRKLTVTFNVEWPALIEKLGPTLVSYEIEPTGDAVRLTVTESHDRPIDDDILSGGRQGWPAILSGLKSLLETGHALALQMAPPQRMLDGLKRLGVAMPDARLPTSE
jgi:uncharacterized protein YndB with AHSA1/START domain